MRSGDVKDRMMALSIVLAPLVLVKLVGVLLGGPEPAGAGAAVVDVRPVESALAREVTQWPDEVLRASERIAALREESFTPSPLYEPPQAAPPVQSTTRPDKLTPPATPEFVVTSIMSSSSASLAIINGRVYREGESLDQHPGWRVRQIDPAGRTVTLMERGTSKTLTVPVQSPRP